MISMSEAIAVVQGMQEKGELEIGPNAMVIRLMGFRIISGRIPAAVRRELNDAVKSGVLGRLPKQGLKPEAYFHPNGKWNAMEARDKAAAESIEAIRNVCGGEPL